LSVLTIAPLHRPGLASENGVCTMERWSWDFVVNGNSLCLLLMSSLIGALGWTNPVIEESIIAKLERKAEPDLPPNRVALFVFPECGDLGCGAITAAMDRQDESISWSDFRWEVNYVDGPTGKYDLRQFRFDYRDYSSALNEARNRRPRL
jgi:hypothetical protein